jgi:hypothetical protein
VCQGCNSDSRCICCCQDTSKSYIWLGSDKRIRFHEDCRQAIGDGLDEYWDIRVEKILGYKIPDEIGDND